MLKPPKSGGFTDKNLEELLVVLEKIKGKFLLSNYARDVLVEKAQANEWYVFRKDMPLKVANFNGNSRRKTEVLVCNYRPSQQEAQLFPE